ncbi:S-glutathione synthase [Xylariaceae sp. FL1272]|nr:S-glutathione synthase [Xylariaceae sp. FL1272]
MMPLSIHPLIDHGIAKGDPDFSGGSLHCRCKNNSVEIKLSGNVAHNHACGCSKCWKPQGALFSIVGVIPRENIQVVAHGDKLQIVDPNAAIQRHACSECGTHLFGDIEKEHPFKPFAFVHVELSDENGWQEPQFAAFVSSIIEQGFEPNRMAEVRQKLSDVGLASYDCLSPALMDAIATWTTQQTVK